MLTFHPHPAKLVAPASAPRLLTTLEERARIILDQGIDEILILPFTPEIAALGPEDFVREILVDKLKARAVLVGANFHFGKRAAGDAAALEELGERYSFETDIVVPVVWRKRVISSSEIRRSIEAGDVSSACRMLGRSLRIARFRGGRRRPGIEANRSHFESRYASRGAAEKWRVRDENARKRQFPRVAVHH